MTTNYVLVDFENVQPRNLEILSKHPFRVIVFVGASQARIPFELANAMQALGPAAEYVKISGNGRNALDFHIALYLGELTARDPAGHYFIISRDTGFEPLVKHLEDRNIRVSRQRDLAEIPVLRLSSARSVDEKIDAIVKNLAGRGQSRPRKVRTLTNTIDSLFTKQMEEAELATLITELQQRGYIDVKDGNVTYRLSH